MNNYYVKVYDKGKQYNLDEERLRFEIKIIKMRQIQDTGIKTLHDLHDTEKLKKAVRHLIRSAEDILINDNCIDVDKLPEDKKKTYEEGSNPEFWNRLRNKISSQSIFQKRKIFRKIVAEHGCNNYHVLFLKALHDKVKSLGFN